MNYFDLFVYIVELVSIVSFSVSGSMVAIRGGLDTFGVVIVGVISSIGGGLIRDLTLGITPPKSFVNPTYAAVAALASIAAFFVYYIHAKKVGRELRTNRIADTVMFWLDTIGLGIFTAVGVSVAYEVSDEFNVYLISFVGVITGVGGGLMRDIIVGNRPYIFVKHFYATACIIGSIVCIYLWNIVGRVASMLICAAVIWVLRFLAAKYRWNMPHVPGYENYRK